MFSINKRKFRLFVFLFLVFFFLWIIYYFSNKKKQIHYIVTETIEAPYLAVFNALSEDKKYVQWEHQLKPYIDSITRNGIYVEFQGKKYFIKTETSEDFKYIRKTSYLKNSPAYQVEFYLTPLSDTLTEVKLDYKTKFPVLSLQYLFHSYSTKETLENLLKNLKSFVSLQKMKVQFQAGDFTIKLPEIPYIYSQYSYTPEFISIFHSEFPNLLILSIQSGFYDFNVKSFILIYPGNGLSGFKAFRNVVPFTHLPDQLPPNTRIDTLESNEYFPVSFNYDYDLLTWNIHQAKKYLPEHINIDPEKPVLIRFPVGHSRKEDPAEWKTEILYPLISRK